MVELIHSVAQKEERLSTDSKILSLLQPVPFCIGSARGLGEVVYCYGHPGCDTCAGAVDDYDAGYCNSQ